MKNIKASRSNPSKQESLSQKVQAWADKFLHSPVGFDGKRPEDIIKADINESKAIFAKELPKRKARESMKSFMTKDELELRYWFVEKTGNQKVKILVHGSGSNFAKAQRAVNLLDRGFNVAMMSYRGHSGNPGTANQKTIVNDVMQAIKEIIKSGYEMHDIYLEGSSLGTAVLARALNKIYQESGSAHQFAGLILKAAPLNLNDRDKDTVESLKAAGIDYKQAQPFLKKLWNQEEAYSQIRAGEIKIVHGSNDDVVPVSHATRIKELLEPKNDNISLEIIKGEGHRLDLDQYGIY